MFGIEACALCLEIQQLLIEDFNAAYFGDESARERIEWVEKNRRLGQSLSVIPTQSKTRASQLFAELIEEILTLKYSPFNATS